jgi:lipoyl(octanoyl) transferase
LKLADDERDLHAYLRHLEEALFEVCASVGLEAGRNPGYTGAWLGPKKVASIGIAVRRWVTLHGFALNVSTELARFASINPCGLQASVMTSLSEAAGRPIELGAIKAVTLTALGRALGRDFQPVPPRG